jgi:hypothetical protein
LQRNFAYHPFVRVIPLQGNPPAEYTVEFRARTLFIRDDGQLDYIAAPALHVWLPPGYPHEPPVVRPMQAIFHPNVTMEGIVMNPAWGPNRTLAQLVQQLGALLAFHTYDPWNVWNPAAMEWVAANSAYLPTDPAASFAPNAGGEPLGRICQSGAKTIEELRGQLQELCTSLLAPGGPPAMEDVRRFAERTRLATNLFLDDDVPESLREPATQLDQWAEALPASTMVFEGLRQRHVACGSALSAAGRLADARRTLNKAMSAFEGLVKEQPAADAYAALGQLPDLKKMQAVQASFKVAEAEAERRLGAARATLAALIPPEPRTNPSHSGLLEKTIEAEVGRATWAVQDATEKTTAAIDTIAPVVARARDELAAFDRVIGWREYADLSAKSQELVERVMGWGSAGVQAYFVENEGGTFGPFEFEQRLDLGDAALVVRNTEGTTIEIFDIKTGGKVAVSDTGETTIQLPGGEPGVAYETTFRLTGRCDDLWVQFEYLTRQVGELLGRLSKPLAVGKAQSWAAAFAQVLSARPAVEAFVNDTKGGMLERDALASDLKLLGRFKERLTTQLLLERYAEMVPRFRKEQADTRKEMQDANQRIAAIFSRSQREVETGQPMIPPKLAKEYEAQTKRRDDAQRRLNRLDRRFATAVAQITARLSSPALYGSDEAPSPALLPPLPQELIARAELMGDEAIGQQITAMERELDAPLRPEAAATSGVPLPQPKSGAGKATAVTPPPPPSVAPAAPVIPQPAPVAPAGELDAAPIEAEVRDQDAGFAVHDEESAVEDAGQSDWIDFGQGSDRR